MRAGNQHTKPNITFCIYLMQKRSGDGGGRWKQQKCGGSCGKRREKKFEQDPNNWIVEQGEEQWSNMHDLSAKNQCTRTRPFFLSAMENESGSKQNLHNNVTVQ